MLNSTLLYEYDSLIIDSDRTVTDVKVFSMGLDKEKPNIINIKINFTLDSTHYEKEIEYMNYSVANTKFKPQFELNKTQFAYLFVKKFDDIMKEDETNE